MTIAVDVASSGSSATSNASVASSVPSTSASVLRVAIIGSGITGLAAASFLHEHTHAEHAPLEFTVFEKDAHVGGHAYTQHVQGTPVDTGFMVFNSVTYPNMLDWFHRYGVRVENSDMSLSVSMDDGAFEWSSDGLKGLFAQRRNMFNPRLYNMVREMVSFKTNVLAFLAQVESEQAGGGAAKPTSTPIMSMTLGDFLRQRGYSQYFIDYYLLPVCASIWSCPAATTLAFPAYFILTFMRNHHLLQLTARPQWLTVASRSQDGYVRKVAAPWWDRIRTNTGVESVRESREHQGKLELRDTHGQTHVFDHVVFATHAPDALRILGDDATPDERELLGACEYQENLVVLHQDEQLMPKSRDCWTSWNFMGNTASKSQQQEQQQQQVSLTYWLNRLQNLGHTDKPVLVTLNPLREPRAELVVSRTVMSHPVPSVRSYQAVQQLSRIQGVRNVWFSGAWTGFGFHEDGFKSGQRAAHELLRQHFAQAVKVGTSPRAQSARALLASAPWSRFQHAYEPLANPPSFVEQCNALTVSGGARTIVLGFLRSFIKMGELELREVGGSIEYIGTPHASVRRACLVVSNAAFYIKVAARADLGFADAYIDGDLTTPSMLDFLMLLIANRDVNQSEHQGRLQLSGLFTAALTTTASYVYHEYAKRNTPEQSRRNIHDHYDTGNPFFRLFLDPTMTYSCGIFRNPTDTLEQAQINKLEALIKHARLSREHKVLEIGFGWGSLSQMIAKVVGCHVTGITLSEEQLKYAQELAESRGLAHLVDYQLIDYRLFQPKGGVKFDRILSCEMLEAVGHEFLGDFYKHCDCMLNESGLLTVQVITFPDHKYNEYRHNVDFIRKRIFPGGLCPSFSALTRAMELNSRFQVERMENIGVDYAPTLAAWRHNLCARWDEAKTQLGYSDAFLRKWEYYFAYCEAGFRARSLNVLHIVYTRPGNTTSLPASVLSLL